MKKNSSIIVGVIVLVLIVGSAFALFHKSNKPAATASTSSSSTTGSAVNNAVLVTKTDASLGQYLATPEGMPLYTYGGDSAGVSNCTGSCLASWPAYQDKGSTTGLPTGISTITRTDNGQVQFTYNGLPLYTFVNDSAGHATGNGVSNFTIAKPAAASTSSSSSSPNQPASTPSTSSSSSSNSNSYSNGNPY